MLNLEDLSQFVAFYKYGTLTKVAEELHISQPTITRTMRRVEGEFGVPLFHRSANRIEFNEVGIKAVQYSEELLKQASSCRNNVLDFHRRLHTLVVYSCAPAPLWTIVPELTRAHANQTISSKLMSDQDEIEKAFRNKECDYCLLTYPLEEKEFICRKYSEEHLSINVPLNHDLAKYSEVTAEIINGYNCLLSPEIGFWEKFCSEKLPSSKFIVQRDEFSFRELIKESNLPCFTTDLAGDFFGDIKNRIDIPITDADANVNYYLIKHRER